MYSEQKVLRFSIAMTFLLSSFGIFFGLLAGSSAIVFDGIYELTDAIMTILALLVANLIRISTLGSVSHYRLVERFTMGFWHLEPMVLGLNGIMLVGAATYAFINAVDSFLAGGRVILFDYAIIYAVISLILEVSMAAFTLRANRKIRSDFLALDAKAWLIAAALSVSWLMAFIMGRVIQDTEMSWVTPYIDPVVLGLVCIAVIPMPIGTVKKALEDILMVTPVDLKEEVDRVAQEVVKTYGFSSYRAYVARVGRGRQIELYFIVPTDWPARRLEEWDQTRNEIEKMLKAESPNHWLTIVFTTDPEWAD